MKYDEAVRVAAQFEAMATELLANDTRNAAAAGYTAAGCEAVEDAIFDALNRLGTYQGDSDAEDILGGGHAWSDAKAAALASAKAVA
jgi:hypothetical protein